LVLVSVSITIRWFYWTKHTIEFSSNTPIQHLNPFIRRKPYRWTVIHVIFIVTAFPRQLNQLYQRLVCHANPFSV